MSRTVRAGVEDLWKKKDGTLSARHGRGLRWRARYVNEFSDEVSKAFRLKPTAQEWLDGETSSRITGKYIDPRKRTETLATFYADWSERQLWTDGTREANDLAMKCCTIKDIPFGELTRRDFELWVKKMQATLKPLTIQTRFANVHAVLRGAIADKMIADDVAKEVKLPDIPKAEQLLIPTPEELTQIIDAAGSFLFSTMIALGAFAGLRLGEICGLQVSDIDFLRREIHIRRQVQRTTGKPMKVCDPKYGSFRTIGAPDELLLMLSQLIALRPTKFAKSEWLFASTQDGKPPFRQTVARWFREARLAGKEHTLHDMRHYYASGLIAAGCDVVDVQHALGHSSPKVTHDTYLHLWPGHQDRTRNAAAMLFRQSVPAPTSDAQQL